MSVPFHDPLWPRARSWLGGETAGPVEGMLAVLGAPVARGSITPGRCDLAPAAVRAALDRFSTWDFEAGHDLRRLAVNDLGDLDVASLSPEDAFEPIRSAASRAVLNCDALVLLGGDNSITRPGVRALAGECGVITFDAHLDLRDTARGLTNGNPIRALLDDGFPGALITQIGIQSFANSTAYAETATRAGIRVVTSEEVHARGIEVVVEEALARAPGVVYVDLDVDILDRAFAPATPGSRPGGLAPWQMRIAARMCGGCAKVRVLDVVEIDPTKDVADGTCLAAASFVLAFASGVLRRCSR